MRSSGTLAVGRSRRISRPETRNTATGEGGVLLDKRKQILFNVGFGVVLLIFVLLLARGNLRESGGIVLPEMPADGGGIVDGDADSGMNVIAVTPDTVQTAVDTLSRPATYQRQQTVELFWSGGSGKTVSQVAVSGDYTRVDYTLADSTAVHMLVVAGTAALWYDAETEWARLTDQEFSADIAQRMLTYEAVLDLAVEDIAEADYRERDGVFCIYLATRENADGYAERYWVSVASGLLLAAERTEGGELVYRFTASEPTAEQPDASLFLLPDGSTLIP